MFRLALQRGSFALSSTNLTRPTFAVSPALTLMRNGGGGGAAASEDEVTARVINILKTFSKITDHSKQLTSDAHFIKDLGLDSLDVVECVVALEDEFVVRFPDAESERIFTPREAAKMIIKAQSKNYA
jgi:NADH dehydrogenase (ubiquinone) 1 alpha/beta subcomplex 1